MRSVLLAPALLAAGSPAFAQAWVLDADASEVTFETRAFGGDLEGRFERFDADIRLDPADLSDARIEATVETNSLAGVAASVRDNALGEAGLDPDAHPRAHFLSETVEATQTGYIARGVLTLRDASQPAEISFTLDITAGRAVAEGELHITSADFGLGGSWGENAAEVTVRLHIEADAAE